MWEQYIVISLYIDKVLGRYIQTGKGFRMLCIHIKWELFIMYIITFFLCASIHFHEKYSWIL